MDTKEAHLRYLNERGGFNINCSFKIFNENEIETLKKYGHWFNGLSNGELTPLNQEQKNFANVFKLNHLPKTFYEKLWFKYLGRRQLELDNPNKFKLDYTIKELGFHTREDYYTLHPERRNRK